MKKLIALLAFTIVLGTSCKKENVTPEISQSSELKANNAKAGVPGPGSTVPPPATYPDGPDTFPHNTGLCYCGKYSVCHPVLTVPTGTHPSPGTGGDSGTPSTPPR